jgi:hypothetical protein
VPYSPRTFYDPPDSTRRLKAAEICSPLLFCWLAHSASNDATNLPRATPGCCRRLPPPRPPTPPTRVGPPRDTWARLPPSRQTPCVLTAPIGSMPKTPNVPEHLHGASIRSALALLMPLHCNSSYRLEYENSGRHRKSRIRRKLRIFTSEILVALFLLSENKKISKQQCSANPEDPTRTDEDTLDTYTNLGSQVCLRSALLIEMIRIARDVMLKVWACL